MMKKALYIFTFLFLSLPAYSTIDITCPPDVTVQLLDVDLNYESYGEPVVDSQNSYVLNKTTNFIGDDCDSVSHILITYTVEDQNGDTRSCAQRIETIRPTVAEIVFPNDIEFDGVSLEEALKDPLTLPKHYSLLWGNNFLATHNDKISFPLDGSRILRIFRKSAVLDWCSAEVAKDSFEIRIINYIKEPSTPLFSIEACHGTDLDVFNFEIITDQANYQLSLDACRLYDADLKSYLNCIAEANDISSDSHLILEIYTPNDYLNGISTLDLILTIKHILGIQTFDNTCELLAADINNDSSVTAIDILEMRKLILGIINAFSNKPSWQILNTKALDPITNPEEQDLMFRKDEFPLTELELTAVKIGDVSGNAK